MKGGQTNKSASASQRCEPAPAKSQRPSSDDEIKSNPQEVPPTSQKKVAISAPGSAVPNEYNSLPCGRSSLG
jgi:hypothetical protein